MPEECRKGMHRGNTHTRTHTIVGDQLIMSPTLECEHLVQCILCPIPDNMDTLHTVCVCVCVCVCGRSKMPLGQLS